MRESGVGNKVLRKDNFSITFFNDFLMFFVVIVRDIGVFLLLIIVIALKI